MSKLLKNTFALFLILSMVLCYVPADSFVTAAAKEELDSSQNTALQTEVREVVGLREETAGQGTILCAEG